MAFTASTRWMTPQQLAALALWVTTFSVVLVIMAVGLVMSVLIAITQRG